jgi:ATP-binding cassette subfamily C protein CydD
MNRELFRLIKPTQIALILTVIFGVLGSAALIAQMTFLSKIVSQVFFYHENLTHVVWLLIPLLGLLTIHAGMVWASTFTAQQSAIRAKSAVRERLLAHVVQLGPAYTKNEATGELVATASAGIERLDAYVSRYLPQMALSVLIPLLIASYVLLLDWMSALLLLITCPIIPLLMILVGSYAEKHVQRQWLTLARMSAHFLDAVQGLPTLKLFSRSSEEHARIARVSERFRDQTMKVLRVAFLSGMVLEFMIAVAIGLIAVTLGVRLLNGGISFEHAFLILLLAPEFYRPLRELGVHHHAGMEGKVVIKRISEILRTPPSAQQSVEVDAKFESEGRPQGPLTITLTDITYTYPSSKHAALQGVHLTLPAGSCTALIGRSGAGKSTLVNVLMRFIDAQSGNITVNGTPLTAFPVEQWREYVALVPQRPYLFADSISANIRLARPDANDHEVALSAELAGATEFISQFSQGYDTLIGERGMRLSAGQAQRIALARAFLKDAPLLILDEPTSSLDPESETLIRRALEHLMQNRTVLVIAHRQNTIASAQQIAVLQDGKIVEFGSQSRLRSNPGAYLHLMGRQEMEVL